MGYFHPLLLYTQENTCCRSTSCRGEFITHPKRMMMGKYVVWVRQQVPGLSSIEAQPIHISFVLTSEQLKPAT